jgi:hypothetical protein
MFRTLTLGEFLHLLIQTIIKMTHHIIEGFGIKRPEMNLCMLIESWDQKQSCFATSLNIRDCGQEWK